MSTGKFLVIILYLVVKKGGWWILPGGQFSRNLLLNIRDSLAGTRDGISWCENSIRHKGYNRKWLLSFKNRNHFTWGKVAFFESNNSGLWLCGGPQTMQGITALLIYCFSCKQHAVKIFMISLYYHGLLLSRGCLLCLPNAIITC